jgi:hypothetical protein
VRGILGERASKRQLHNAKISEVFDRHHALLDAEIRRLNVAPGTDTYRDLVRRHLTSARDEIDHVLGQFFSEERAQFFGVTSKASVGGAIAEGETAPRFRISTEGSAVEPATRFRVEVPDVQTRVRVAPASHGELELTRKEELEAHQLLEAEAEEFEQEAARRRLRR